MKAIETEYNGILFRSKTEARWALFMDVIGCKYVYEPEGYDLGDNIFYCPDFYLPKLDAFLEIKPITGGLDSPTEKFVQSTRKTIYTMYGIPCHVDDREFGLNEIQYYINNSDIETCVGWDDAQEFCICPNCRRVSIQYCGRTDRINCRCQKSNHGDKGYNWDDPLLLKAYSIVKQSFRWKKS